MRKISRQDLVAFFKKVDHRHYACIGITIAFALISAFCFPYAFPRMGEAFRDFGLSVAYYFTELFGFRNVIAPSVTSYTKMPFTLTDRIPVSWEEFKIRWEAYWPAFIDGNNVVDYFVSFRKGLLIFGYVMTFVVPIIVIACILISKSLKSQNVRHNEDTKPLKAFKKFSDKTYRPIKAYLISLFSFIRDYRFTLPSGKKPKKGDIPKVKEISYLEIWAFIWLINFNVVTILLEAFAYYFYFIVEFDVLSLYTQVYKLLLDLSVMFKFIPVPGWLLIGWIIFDKIRKKRGYDNLYHNEAKNCGFINERSVFGIAAGSMRAGKDKFMTDMALSKANMYRDQCLATMRKSDLKFPYFPWIEFERNLLIARERGVIKNLAQTRDYVRHIERCFILSLQNPVAGKSCRKHLHRAYGYTKKDLCFGYDIERYPLEYDNAKYIERIFDVLCDYAQAYFIYTVQTSFILANYSIREDAIFSSIGNFPIWNGDFFTVRSRDVDYISRFCKVLNWDFVRLGKKVGLDPDFAFEFGIVNITEMGKDRPNMVEAEGIKRTDEQTNPKNDGFNDEVKIVGHGATVDYYCFASITGNDQREEQIPASLLGTAEILRIESCDKGYLAMPFFFFGERLHEILNSLWEKLHKKQRFNKGNNTLLYYVLHTLVAKYESYYDKLVNMFGYERMTVSVQDGHKENEKQMHTYYISNKKLFSKRYATDAFSDVLAVRGKRATKSIDEIPSYASGRPSDEEMESTNSYFYPRITAQVQGNAGKKQESDLLDSEYSDLIDELSKQFDLPKETVVKLMQKQREKLLAKEIEGMMNQ